jgi:ATP-dependent DNA helicase RecQ
MTANDMERAQRVLRERFGHSALRPAQSAAVAAVLAGRDGLVTLPTGGGKSLCYQLPALVLPGTTLVVSPLIALMQDQVEALRARGVPATFVNSTLERRERERRLAAVVRGEVPLLYVTPERFRSTAFREVLPHLRVTRLAVDEAHCISEWGHDFRPDYHRLGSYRALLGDPPTIALTATATPRVLADIATELRLEDPLVVRGGIDRPNLFLALDCVATSSERVERVAERVAAIDGPGIVYSTLVREVEWLHDELARRGIATLVYHGRLSPRERREMQARFMAAEREVVLATSAFGLGIDKRDIRFVIHAQLPRTIEALTQEFGRAGRDGVPAWCETFALDDDLSVQQEFVRAANPSREFVERVHTCLVELGPRASDLDEQELARHLGLRERRDGRIGVALGWLVALGAVAGSFEGHDLCAVGAFDASDLPAAVGREEKLAADLSNLLAVWRLARPEDPGAAPCRRVELARHFEVAAPTEPCGACDRCADGATFLARHFRPRPQAPRTEARRPASVRFARGDWVRVGPHIGRIARVEGEGPRDVLFVEGADDLVVRRVDPRRQSVERIDR